MELLARAHVHRVFFVLLLLPLLLPFPYVRALNNPNELVRVYTVIALVENGTYRVDEQIEAFGWTEDLAHVPHADGGEHHAMVKGPGVLLAGVPAYAASRLVMKAFGLPYPGRADHPASSPEALAAERRAWLAWSIWAMRLVTCQLPAFFFLLWFERWLRAFSRDRWLRYAVVLGAALGTNFLAYAHMFASHVPYAMSAFLAFGLVERERRARAPRETPIARAALVGFFTSLCVALEYQALPLAVVLTLFAVFVFRRTRPILAFLVGGAPNVLHVAWFQWCAYGDPFSPGHKLLENARFAAEHKSGFWGIFLPKLGPLVALAFDPGFGLFAMSPLLVLGVVAVPLVLARPWGALAARAHLRVVTVVAFSGVAVVALVNAGFVEWRAGWTVGPRYLVVCAPLLAFASLLALERFARRNALRRQLARSAAAGLALAGIVSIGTVGILVHTLPDTIARPFAQFVVPMAKAGLVPHDLGVWAGLRSGPLYHVALASMLVAPFVLVAFGSRGRRAACLGVFAVSAILGISPAFSKPRDGSALFELHPSTAWFATSWEPREGASSFRR